MAGARDSGSAVERGAIGVGFDHAAQAHAPIYTPCLVGFLARTKPRDVEGCERRVEGFARRHVLQHRAGRHGPWQLGRGQHVAPPYRNRIEVQGARYGLNRASITQLAIDIGARIGAAPHLLVSTTRMSQA